MIWLVSSDKTRNFSVQISAVFHLRVWELLMCFPYRGVFHWGENGVIIFWWSMWEDPTTMITYSPTTTEGVMALLGTGTCQHRLHLPDPWISYSEPRSSWQFRKKSLRTLKIYSSFAYLVSLWKQFKIYDICTNWRYVIYLYWTCVAMVSLPEFLTQFTSRWSYP